MKTIGAARPRRIAARLEIRADCAEEMRQTLPLDAAAVVEAGCLWVVTLSALRARDGRVSMDAVRVFLVDLTEKS